MILKSKKLKFQPVTIKIDSYKEWVNFRSVIDSAFWNTIPGTMEYDIAGKLVDELNAFESFRWKGAQDETIEC